jgi:hypothetical protein
MIGFELEIGNVDIDRKRPDVAAEAPGQQQAPEAPSPAIQQSIGEITKQFGGKGGTLELVTPEAKAAEGNGSNPAAMLGLGAHGPAAMLAPIEQSVAEIKQTVQETKQAAPSEEQEASGAPAPANAPVASAPLESKPDAQHQAAPVANAPEAQQEASSSKAETVAAPDAQGAATPEHAAAAAGGWAAMRAIWAIHQHRAAPEQQEWAAANSYNERHPTTVQAFIDATGSACLAADGTIDPDKVSQWQHKHGLAADGMVGPLTVAAAKKRAHGHQADGGDQGHAEVAAHVGHAGAQGAGPASGHAAKAPAQAAHGPAEAQAEHGHGGAAGPDLVHKLLAQVQGLLREFASGIIDKAHAVEKLLAFDKKLSGGALPSMDVLAMIPAFLGQLLHVKPQQAPEGHGGEPAAPVNTAPGEPFRAVVDGGSSEVGFQKCLVFASPGGVTATPDIFLFFHGYEAQYGIDDKQQDKKGVVSGADVTAEAMTHARGKNVVAILPQGVIGRGGGGNRSHEGGYMKGLQAGLPTFLSSILSQVAAGLGHEGLSPGHISIAGHSAGGYMGVHDAMKGAGELLDHITDMTLMDSSYADSHFADASRWIFSGSAGKSLRIIGSPGQIQGKGASHHEGYFGKGALAHTAKKLGFTVEHLAAGDQRENKTRTLQHSRILKDGQVHADILVLVANRTHGQIRDDVIDDDIMSIGQGIEKSDDFARTPKTAADLDKPLPKQENVGADDVQQHDEPVPAHEGGNQGEPEKVKGKPEGGKHGGGGVYADKSIYAKGGKLSKEHLHAFGLGEEEFAFKQRVYDLCVARLGDKIYGGVEKDELVHVDGGSHSVRTDVAGPLESMLSAMRADLAAGKVIDGKEVGKATGIRVTSGYRSPEHDRDLWDKYFTKYMAKTQEMREATGDPLGSEAAHLMVKYIGKRKAPAGGSNHSNGIAVDLSMEMSGHVVGNNYDDQHVWKGSWHYAWLMAHAASFGFKNYKAEAWHYDYKP